MFVCSVGGVGKWNGYVLQYAAELLYISGDTSFTPEMNENFGFTQRFGYAFLCMNLPYTMSINEVFPDSTTDRSTKRWEAIMTGSNKLAKY